MFVVLFFTRMNFSSRKYIAKLFILFKLDFKLRLISTRLTIICIALWFEIVMQVDNVGFFTERHCTLNTD